MNIVLKKLFLAITAGAALQAGSPACAASQLGGIYKNKATVAFEALEKGVKGAGQAIQKVTQNQAIQQALHVAKAKWSTRPIGTAFLACLNGSAALASVGCVYLYKKAIKRADSDAQKLNEKEKQRTEDEIFAYGLSAMTCGFLATVGAVGTAGLVFGN